MSDAAADADDLVVWTPERARRGLDPNPFIAAIDGDIVAVDQPRPRPEDAQPERRWPLIENPRQRAFLAAYAVCGANITRAAAAAGINRESHRYWLAHDEDGRYAEAFAEAREDAVARMEAEADRRALEGWEEPVYGKDGFLGTRVRFSDQLLMFRLKALSPGTYADRREVTTRGEHLHVHLNPNDARNLARERISDRLAALEERFGSRDELAPPPAPILVNSVDTTGGEGETATVPSPEGEPADVHSAD